jgi:hypothetical protein
MPSQSIGEKGKLIERRGRKATGLGFGRATAAGLLLGHRDEQVAFT